MISDTDVRTEGILRSRFDKAIECSPSILLLKNIDALARKSQALETGQEPTMVGILNDCIEGLKKSRRTSKKKKIRKIEKSQINGIEESESIDEEEEEEDEDDEIPQPTAIVATTSEPEKCPSGILSCFKHEFSIEVSCW